MKKFICVFLICSLFISCSKKKDHKKTFNEKRTVKVEEKSYSHSVDISGYLEANETQKVQLRVSGGVTGVFAKEGQAVKKGDVLVTVDDTSQKYTLIKIAQELEKAKITGSAKEIELLEYQLKTAQTNMTFTQATANFDGVIVKVDVEEGDYVKAGETLELMILADLSVLKATVEIDEIDIRGIREGQKVNLNFDAYPEGPVEAYISYIPRLGSYNSTNGIGYKEIELTIKNPPKEIFPGCSFSATIDVTEERKYKIIPSSVVRSSRGRSYITKLDSDGRERQIEVTCRYLGEGLSEILSGDINIGDEVVMTKAMTMSEKLNPNKKDSSDKNKGGMPGPGGGGPRF